MIPHTISQPLAVNFNPHFHHPNAPILTSGPVQTSSITFAPPISNIQGVVITQLPSIPSNHSIMYQRVRPQVGINIISPVIQDSNGLRTSVRPSSEIIQIGTNRSQKQFQEIKRQGERSAALLDLEKQELREEVKRLLGLLRKNQEQTENVKRQLIRKNQSLSEFERRVSSGQSHQVVINSQFKSLEQQNNKLRSIIQRMNIDRQSLVKSHEKYMKNDELARTQIFGQVQKLQKAIQLKTKQLQETKQRQIIISKQFEVFKNQTGNQLNQNERNTVHLMEKLKVSLQGKQLQIQSLNQAIQQLDINLSHSQKSHNESIYRIKQLESYILQIEEQNTNLKEYQNHRQHQITFESNNQLSILRTQVIELQRNLQIYREREKQAVSTYAGVSDKDHELKLKIAMQQAESNHLTMQYLSKEINNYRLIIQDLQSYKENGYKKDIEISRLHQTIVSKQKQLVEVESAAEELRLKLKNSEKNYHSTYQRSEEVTRHLEEKCVSLNRKIEVLEAEKVGLGQVESVHTDIHISELTKALDLSRNQYFSLRKTSDQKIFQLEAFKADLQTQLRTISITVDQKQAERAFFQNQYKTLYSQFVEIKKYSTGGNDSHLQVRQLKQRLFFMQQQNHRLQTQLIRVIEAEKDNQGRPTFNNGDQLSRARGIIDQHNNNRKYQQHHRQTQSMTGLREENQHLKLLLEDAQRKIEEYASDLDECQHRMGIFQERMENLLGGGNGSGRQTTNYKEYIHQQRQVMVQVEELKNKLKAFKKQNEQLKRKVKQTKQENKRVRKQSKSKTRESEKRKVDQQKQKIIEQNQQIINQNKVYQKRIQQITYQIGLRDKKIFQLSEINQKINLQVLRVQQINTQNQQTLKEYEKNIAQYEQAINKHEARIKDYQAHMLKIKHKYKEEANTRVPQTQIQRPINSTQNVSQRLQFFRVKSQQAEQRVKHLLKINTQLNFQLQQTSSLIGGQNLNTHKIHLLQSNVEILEKKLISAAQQNLELKARMETADDTNVSKILEVKVRQLMQENSDLGVQINQAHSQIFNLKQHNQQLQQTQFVRSQNEQGQIQKFRYLEQKFQSLNQVIYSLESEKQQLQNENTELKLRSSNQSIIQNQNIFLQQISDLQHQVYQLKLSKRQLQLQLQQLRNSNSSPSSQSGVVSMQTYSILMIQVDKLMQYTDALNSTFGSIIDVIARTEIEQLKLAIDGYVVEAGDIFKGIDIIKYSLGGLRQQSQTAIMIHQMNQII